MQSNDCLGTYDDKNLKIGIISSFGFIETARKISGRFVKRFRRYFIATGQRFPMNLLENGNLKKWSNGELTSLYAISMYKTDPKMSKKSKHTIIPS
jgi:hypothetical protein